MHCDLPVRVTPRSSQNKIVRADDGSVRVWVTASPTDGQANDAVCVLIAGLLDIAKTRISFIRGQSSRDKVLRIEGITADVLNARLSSTK